MAACPSSVPDTRRTTCSLPGPRDPRVGHARERHASAALLDPIATRSRPTVEAVERGQGSVEYAGLLAALVVLVGVIALVAASHPPEIAWSDLIRVPRHRTARTADERALRDPVLGPIIAASAPSIVLERDEYGRDFSIPVSDGCRSERCAAYGQARCVLYVHVVRRPARTVFEYWTYYPTSQTDHLPVVALQGYHRDDWEGVEVAFDARGALEGARGSAHLGWNGSAPWWDQRRDNWAPYDGIAYRAAGSHATGLAPRRPRSCRRCLERRPRRRRGTLVRAARRRSGRARRAPVRLRRRGSLGEAGLDRSRRRAHRRTRIVSRVAATAARAWALGLDAAGVGLALPRGEGLAW